MRGLSKAANMVQRAIERARDKGDLTFDLACLRAGRKFPANRRFDTIADADRAVLYIENQSTDLDYVVSSIGGVKGTQLLDLTFSRQATEVTPGIEEDVMNANTQAPRTFSGVVRTTDGDRTGEYTHGDPTYFEDIVPGSATGAGGGGQGSTTGGITFTVPAGENALVTATNVSGNLAQRVSMPFVIYEVDPEFVLSEKSGTSYFNPRWQE